MMEAQAVLNCVQAVLVSFQMNYRGQTGRLCPRNRLRNRLGVSELVSEKAH